MSDCLVSWGRLCQGPVGSMGPEVRRGIAPIAELGSSRCISSQSLADRCTRVEEPYSWGFAQDPVLKARSRRPRATKAQRGVVGTAAHACGNPRAAQPPGRRPNRPQRRAACALRAAQPHPPASCPQRGAIKGDGASPPVADDLATRPANPASHPWPRRRPTSAPCAPFAAAVSSPRPRTVRTRPDRLSIQTRTPRGRHLAPGFGLRNPFPPS